MPGETAADDQDAFRDRLCYRWLFLRERFGQNCSHGCTNDLQGPAARLALGYSRASGPILNGGAVHRTSYAAFYAGAGNTRSNSMRGRISPKVMAMMIRNAVAPFVAMLVSRAAGALGPIETNSTRPVAALKQGKSPASMRRRGAGKGESREGQMQGDRLLASRGR